MRPTQKKSRKHSNLTKNIKKGDANHFLFALLCGTYSFYRGRFGWAETVKIMSKETCCRQTFLEGKVKKTFASKLQKLIDGGLPVQYKKGQTLFYKGHLPCGVFVLVQGEVAYYRNLKEKPFTRRKPPEAILGLGHLISDLPYCANCKVEEDAQVVFLTKVAILEALKSVNSPK